MSNQSMKCKNCGQEICAKAVVCPNCGVKNKKPIYKRWWFIALAVIIIIGIFSSMSGENENQSVTQEAQQEIVYTEYSVKELLTDLEDNALNAKNKYDGQYVKLTGKLNNIDSSGDYISLDDGSITFYSVMCYLKNDEHINKVSSRKEGDTVVV